MVERDGKKVCSGVKGILGYPLLVENEDHAYRVFPKADRRTYMVNDSSDSDSSSSDNGSDNGSDHDSDQDPEPEIEVINKVAPEGIEVAEFDGLNINEDMS